MSTTRSRIILLVLAITVLLSAGCTQPSGDRNATPATATAVPGASIMAISVPFAPIPVASRDGVNIAYELECVPAGNVTLVPEMVEVLDSATGAVLYTANGTTLATLYHPAAVPPPAAGERRNGTVNLTYPRISLWLVRGPDAVPDRLVHRVTLNRTAEGLAPITVTGGEVAVRKDRQPVVIGAPLRGPGWGVMETTSADTHHFRDQITMNNVTRVPQRYAQDWFYMDPATGKLATGNLSLAADWLGYGKEVCAVASGTVVEAVNDQPDLATIYAPRQVSLTTAGGNSVILDIGDRKYACYGHMIPGSVRVKAGDAVTEGQVIGLMGNSGNSDIPHLHFQVVAETPSLLGAEGYPHVYRSFNLTGTASEERAKARASLPGASILDVWDEFGSFVTVLPEPAAQANRLPENWDIVRFP